MNLTLAGSQSDFVRNHVNIIPAPVKDIFEIVLANFANNEGLASEGDNVWSATQSSGVALLGTAGTGNFGTLTNGALEASNVDLSKELVNMIVAQRNYQSNAQTIKTQDQILNTLVNLR